MGGENHSITWSGNLDEDLNISLYNNGLHVQTITAGISLKGSYNWTLPDNLPYASTYQVKVSATKNPAVFCLSKNFKISEKPGSSDNLVYREVNYKTIKIGTQWWMSENLKTTEFNDGLGIQYIADNTQWLNASIPAYSTYPPESDQSDYGTLYNWFAVNTGKLCPLGWHVPAGKDWEILSQYLGGEAVAGSKLKEAGTIHWISPNTGATNESGFSGLPGGYRLSSIVLIGTYGCWWSSTESNTDNAAVWSLNYNNTMLNQNGNPKKSGASIRCLRD